MAVEVEIDGNTTNLDAKLAETRRKIKETAEQGSSAASAAGSALGAVSGELGALGGAVGAAGSMIAQLAMGPIGMVTAAITALVTAGIDAWQNLTQSAEEYGSVLDKLADKYDALQKKTDDKKKSSESYMDRIREIDARGNSATGAEKKEREKLLSLLSRNYGSQRSGESREAYFSRIQGIEFEEGKRAALLQYGGAKRQTSFAIDSAANSIGIGKWWEKDALRNLMKGLSPEQLSEFAYGKMHKATTQGEIDAWEKLAKAARNEAEKKREWDNLVTYGSRSEADIARGLQEDSSKAQKAQQDAAAKAKATADATAGRDAAREALKDAEAAAKGGDDLEHRTLDKLAKLRQEITQKEQEATRKTGDERLKAEKEVFDLKKQEIALEQTAKNLAAQKAQKQAAERAANDAAVKARDNAQKALDEARARQAGGQVWQSYLEQEKRDTDAEIQREQRRIQTLSGTDRLKAEKNLIDLQRKSLNLGQSINAAASAQQQKWTLPDYITNDLTRRGGGIGLAAASNNVVDINKNILAQQRASVSVQNAILNAVQNIGVTIP